MPICGNCTQPCSCALSEDGFSAGHPELGRNFTQVEGTGTTDDPYVIHFLDQEEFRPRTAEIQYASRSVPSSGFSTSVISTGPTPRSFLIYESPIMFVVKDPAASDDNVYRYAGGNYYYIGASVTFAETADLTSNVRQMLLTNVRGAAFPAAEYVIAGQTTPGAGGDPLTLQCGGIAPGIFFDIPGFGDVRLRFGLYVFQNSGSDMNVSDIRIWVTQI